MISGETIADGKTLGDFRVITQVEIAPLSAIVHDRLYSLREAARFIPASRGSGRISIHVLRRLIVKSGVPTTTLNLGSKRPALAVLGRDLLSIIQPRPVSPIAVETPADRDAHLRSQTQTLANLRGKPCFQQKLNEWFYPPQYTGPRPPKPTNRGGRR